MIRPARLAVALSLAALAAQAQPAATPKHRGVSWVAGGEIGAEAFDPLVAAGVEWIVQTPFGWQRAHDAPGLRLVTDGRILWGERDAGLEATTRMARARGIRTLLKPHIWLHERSRGHWRSDIAMASEEDWRTWFDEYRNFILHYARLAERLEIEALAVGTELRATVVARPQDWRRLVGEVRAVYSGELTYAANWWREFEEVPFWDLLDYVGIQAYFPLTERERPSAAELAAGWRRWLPAIAAVAERSGKPVLFTEIGYRAASDSAIEPWRWPSAEAHRSPGDEITQAAAYRAFFEAFWHQPWFAGAYIWKWFPGLRGAARGGGFSPQGRPAEAVLAEWYRRPAVSTSAR